MVDGKKNSGAGWEVENTDTEREQGPKGCFLVDSDSQVSKIVQIKGFHFHVDSQFVFITV